MVNIAKRFGAVTALEDVSFCAKPGRVHGLLGENGAGKSTLMNVLFGLLPADAGEVKVGGKAVRIGSPRAAQALGIGMVHQHFKLVPTLTVAENLALALHTSVRRVRGLAKKRTEALGWGVSLEKRVEAIGVGQQQRAEILKALLAMDLGGRGDGTLILDEPTAVLTPQETTELFTAIAGLKEQGTAIVFISHKLAEVQRICDEVTILRRGRVVHSGPAAEMTTGEMAEKMVGSRIEMPHLAREERKVSPGGAPALTLEAVSCGMVRDVSLTIGRGEIVGVAGVDGNGQSDLVQAIVGARTVEAGRILLAGEEGTRRSIRWRVERMAFIAEDRHREAMVVPMSVQENLLLKDYRRPRFSSMGWLRFGAWRMQSRELVQKFDVRCHSLTDPAGRLSGGNQQKMVLARELYSSEKPLVVAVNPTRGLDVGATAFVMRRLLDARARGAGVLLVHGDLDELLAISDRVAVMFEGQLHESRWPNETKEGIGKMMLGLTNRGGV